MYPKKVAFVHYGKAAGVYVNKYIKQTCLESYTKYFSHHANLNPFEIEKRDWRSDELPMESLFTPRSKDLLAVLHGDDFVADGNYAMELWYQYEVTDNISVTPGIYWLSRPYGDATPDDKSFGVFGGVVQTVFKF